MNTNSMDINQLLGQEWVVLQNSYDQYEKGGLFIKLAGFVLFATSIALDINVPWVVTLLFMLWVQEGIYRTFQSRIGQRTLRVEKMIALVGAAHDSSLHSKNDNIPFQLHSEWSVGRKGILGLLVEYATSACKPTVAYPYVVLITGILVFPRLSG